MNVDQRVYMWGIMKEVMRLTGKTQSQLRAESKVLNGVFQEMSEGINVVS